MFALGAAQDRIAQLTEERDRLRASRDQLLVELQLMSKRIFVAKAERVDTEQLEMEFAAKLAELDRIGGALPPADDAGEPPTPPKRKPTGRRRLRDLRMPLHRVEQPDPDL